MGKKHPLEIFRANPEGFEHASRERRTVTGRVVGTSLRPLPPAVSSARGTNSSAGSRRSAAGGAAERRGPLFSWARLRPSNRKSLYGVLAIFGAFTLYLMGVSSSSPALKRPLEEVFSSAPLATERPVTDQPASLSAAAMPEYTILAATYAGSEHGKTIATITRDELLKDGFPRTQVVGYPGKVAGEYEHFELLIGRATRQADLNGLLDQVRRYRGPANDPLPFSDAYVQELPEVLLGGS